MPQSHRARDGQCNRCLERASEQPLFGTACSHAHDGTWPPRGRLINAKCARLWMSAPRLSSSQRKHGTHE
eukprot:931421-Prymnesium_polylepis.1